MMLPRDVAFKNDVPCFMLCMLRCMAKSAATSLNTCPGHEAVIFAHAPAVAAQGSANEHNASVSGSSFLGVKFILVSQPALCSHTN